MAVVRTVQRFFHSNVLIALRAPHRVIEIEPNTGRIVWQFEKTGVETIRDVDRLSNGNTLIVERTKILEITPAGNVIWQLGIEGVGGMIRDKDRWLSNAQRIAPH